MKEPKSSSYTPDYSVENPGLISMYDRNENESRAIENTAASNRREERTNIRLDRNSAAEQRIVKHEELGSICRPLNSGWLSNNEYLHRNLCMLKCFGRVVGSRPDSRVSLWSMVLFVRCI